jgi:transcription-repair coupling factor (superfamily II helicase)
MSGLRDFAIKIAAVLKDSEHTKICSNSEGLSYLGASLIYKNFIADKSLRHLVIVSTEKNCNLWKDYFSSYLLRAKDQVKVVMCKHALLLSSSQTDDLLSRLYLRSDFLTQIAQENKIVVIASLEGLLQKTISIESFSSKFLSLQVGDLLEVDDFVHKLLGLGYRKSEQAARKGLFAVRGGIVDVFLPSSDYCYRFEFMGSSLFSLTLMAPVPQNVLTCQIFSAFEFVSSVEQRSLAKNDSRLEGVFLQEDLSVVDQSKFAPALLQNLCPTFSCLQENSKFYFTLSLSELNQEFERFCVSIFSKENLFEISECFSNLLSFEKFITNKSAIEIKKGLDPSQSENNFYLKSVDNNLDSIIPSAKGESEFVRWEERFKALLESGFRVILFCARKNQQDFMESLLASWIVSFVSLDDVIRDLLKPEFVKESVLIAPGCLPEIVCDKLDNLVLLDADNIAAPTKSKDLFVQKMRKIICLKDLIKGDLIVHYKHGVGRFVGLVNLDIGVGEQELLKIEYCDSNFFYLPVDRIGSLEKYQGSGDNSSCKLDKIGGSAWKKRKSQVKKNLEQITSKLLALYAKRTNKKSYKLYPSGEIYDNFVNDFPYAETPDQIKVMEEVNSDLSLPFPMDRLLVGDVGFGKTEIALRSACQAVIEGFQVLILVPTTVLCFQHFQRFKQRFLASGIIVAQLSRFVKRSENLLIRQKFQERKIDVLLGTHSLIKGGLDKSNVALVIIDEEQRFGVLQKEAIREGCPRAHLLMMSATPIPRTLNMSLLGLRDISMLNTPPPGRLLVKLEIKDYSEHILKKAINFELRRGGQVFVVVHTIKEVQEFAQLFVHLFSDLKFVALHGQMPQASIEKSLVDFVERKYELLLCTTIIENGIDIANANTLIVPKANYFGLSQLYQLKGRVGRSSTQAFAYFLSTKNISEQASLRLLALQNQDTLGGSFHIATQDMNIRGVGDLLGKNQSGNVAAVGYETFTRLVAQEVERQKLGSAQEFIEPEIKLSCSLKLSNTYIVEERERIKVYRSLFFAQEAEDIVKVFQNIESQYGICKDDSLQNLLDVALIRYWLIKMRALSLVANHKMGIYVLKLSKESMGKKSLQEFIASHLDVYHLRDEQNIFIKNLELKKKSGLKLSLNNLKFALENLARSCF